MDNTLRMVPIESLVKQLQDITNMQAQRIAGLTRAVKAIKKRTTSEQDKQQAAFEEIMDDFSELQDTVDENESVLSDHLTEYELSGWDNDGRMIGLEDKIKQLTTRTTELEDEIKQLKAELKQQRKED